MEWYIRDRSVRRLGVCAVALTGAAAAGAGPPAVPASIAPIVFASWRFDGTADARLSYGDVPVVTGGTVGAFSCFCAVRLDTLDADDKFFLGKTEADGRGWRLHLDRTVDGTGDENRFCFFVSGGPGLETERYSATEATTGPWTTLGGSLEWTDPLDPPGDMWLYVDGVDDSAPPRLDARRPPAVVAAPLTIGGEGAPGAVIGKLGYAAIWDGVALTADEHALLAAGADPRTIRPDDLTFYARLEEDDGRELLTGAFPEVGEAAQFDTDRWPGARPLIIGLGDPTPTSIKIASFAGRAANHRIAYSTDGSYSTLSDVIASDVETDFVVVHHLTGLAPSMTYEYRLLLDDVAVRDGDGTFATAPDSSEAAFRFAYSACTQFDLTDLPHDRYPRGTFEGVAARSPDFAVHSGDVWYSDQGGSDSETEFNAWAMNDVNAMNRKARQMLGERDFAEFQKHVPIYMMPDDHEFTNDCDEEDRSDVPISRWGRSMKRVLNWQFQKNPPRTAGAIADKGLWYTFTYGGVDFFFIDMRTQRGINGNPGTGTMLGNTEGLEDGQLGELLAWLDASTAKFKVILAPSMLSDFGTTFSDSWCVAFPDDQQQVIDAIRLRHDVVYFAGDVHWSGVTRLAASDDGDPAHDLIEFVGGTYGGHLSTPPDDSQEDVIFSYDGALVEPVRYSYLMVDVDTTVVPATMVVSLVSHEPCSGEETVEYVHSPLLSRTGCTGDVDVDGRVGFQDLLRVLSSWGVCFECREDLDGNFDVGFTDLVILLSRWGPCP